MRPSITPHQKRGVPARDARIDVPPGFAALAVVRQPCAGDLAGTACAPVRRVRRIERPTRIRSTAVPHAASQDDDLPLDLLKGAVAGAVAVWAMDRLGWALWNREDPAALARERAARVEGMDPAHVLANRVADAVGRPLQPRQPHPAGIAVHYGIGMAPAMAYAALRRQTPALRTGRGLAYGLGMFLLVDEGVVPALGLASGPAAYPWQAHARGLVTHLLLGVATDVTLDVLDRLLDGDRR